jgi:hypothetical protein
MPTVTGPMPDQESSQVRNAQSERLYARLEPGEAERCSQELAALVEHRLFDHFIRPLE